MLDKFKFLLSEAKSDGDKVRINLYSYVLGQLQNEVGRGRAATAEYLDKVVREVINGIDQSLANLKADDERIVSLLKEKELLLVHKLPDVVTLTDEEEKEAIAKIHAELGCTTLSEFMRKLRELYTQERLNGKATVERVNTFLRSLK